MASLNLCTFIGNLGQDPDVKYLPSGDAVASISIATTESWKDKATGEKKEKTEWIRCEFYGKLAEIVGQYLKKGSSVYVQGRMQTREYVDKEGIKRYATSIKCDSMQMLGGRQDGGGSAPQQQRPAQQSQQRPATQQRPAPAQNQNFSDMDNDIPFTFSANVIHDGMGQSKAALRAKHGRGLSIKHVNCGEF